MSRHVTVPPIEHSLRADHVELPTFRLVDQRFAVPPAIDVATRLEKEWRRLRDSVRLTPGDEIAIAVGSRRHSFSNLVATSMAGGTANRCSTNLNVGSSTWSARRLCTMGGTVTCLLIVSAGAVIDCPAGSFRDHPREDLARPVYADDVDRGDVRRVAGPADEADAARECALNRCELVQDVAHRREDAALRHEEPDGRGQQRVAAPHIGAALHDDRACFGYGPVGLTETKGRLTCFGGPLLGDTRPSEARRARDAAPGTLAHQSFDRVLRVLPGGDDLDLDAKFAEPIDEQVDAFPGTEHATLGQVRLRRGILLRLFLREVRPEPFEECSTFHAALPSRPSPILSATPQRPEARTLRPG